MSSSAERSGSRAKGSSCGCRSSVQGRARTRGHLSKGVAEMKFKIYQHLLTALLVTATLVHTFGAKWG
jgi:hypothetical protein